MGDTAAIAHLLREHPGLASSPLGGAHGGRTALHIVTDWPGYFPRGPLTAAMLLAAGADANARNPGRQFSETPLHWAASSDDSEVAVVLIDHGADLDAMDGSIGTPLGNAVGYTCWHVARLLVARGARVDEPWQAAALGLVDRLEELLGADPSPVDVSRAFWHACSGEQRRTAELLLDRGADLNWVPGYSDATPLDAASTRSTRRSQVVDWLHALGARSAR